MALFAHTIVSNLSGPVETVQTEVDIAELTGTDATVDYETSRALTGRELDAAWRNERAFGPNAHYSPIDFVPARLHFDDFGQLLNPGSSSSAQAKSGESGQNVSTWYRSLLRTPVPTKTIPQPIPSILAPPVTSDTHPSITAPTAANISTAGNSSVPSRDPKKLPDISSKRKNDWFIQNVLVESSSLTSAPLPSTSTPQTISEMLAREPPSDRGKKVPVWTHIGPGNRGFALLQRAGWEEGSALGASSSRSTEGMTPAQPTNRSRTSQERTMEVIDLTGDDDDDEQGDEEPNAQESSDDGRMDDDSSQTPVVPKGEPVDTALMHSSGYEQHGTALLVPLPAFLKPDKHGIGLDSLKQRRQMRLRNTQQALSTSQKPGLERHSKFAQETRRQQQKFGRGARGYARTSQKESETRQDIMRYMNS